MLEDYVAVCLQEDNARLQETFRGFAQIIKEKDTEIQRLQASQLLVANAPAGSHLKDLSYVLVAFFIGFVLALILK